MADCIQIEVVYALQKHQFELALSVPEGTTVQQALELAAGEAPFAELDLDDHQVGIYAEIVHNRQRVLNAGDRLEIYRPLQLNPMQQRQLRAQHQSQIDTCDDNKK